MTGRGTLDGLAQYEYVDMRGKDPEIEAEREIARASGVAMKCYYRTGMQTYMFILNDLTDVRLEGITVLNSPLWNVRLNGCDRVFIRGVYIYSDLEKGVNSDGIDIVSSSNVTISDSVVVTADDAIVIKTQGRAGAPAKPAENIAVTNCILTSSSTAMVIGTETQADIRHVVFSNSVIRDSKRAFGINVQDGATVSDIRFSNTTMDSRRRHWNWWASAETFKFILKKRTPTSKLGVIRDVVIDNVITRPRGTSTLTGHPDRPLENITVSNVEMLVQPEDVPDKRATDAIQVKGVKGLKIRNVSVTWNDKKPEPKWRSALTLQDVAGLELDNFTGRQGLKEGTAPVILLENVTDGILRNLRAADGSGTFLEFRGVGNKDLSAHSNELRKAAQPVAFTEGASATLIKCSSRSRRAFFAGRSFLAMPLSLQARTLSSIRSSPPMRLVESLRQCVFAGTVNHGSYLRDETGGRRFWPIVCGRIDVDRLGEVRDQLWAEAKVKYESGSVWWLDTPELVQLASDQQEERYESDPWEEVVAPWLENKQTTAISEVLQRCIDKPQAQWTQTDKIRAARCLRAQGRVRYRERQGKRLEWRYRRVV